MYFLPVPTLKGQQLSWDITMVIADRERASQSMGVLIGQAGILLLMYVLQPLWLKQVAKPNPVGSNHGVVY